MSRRIWPTVESEQIIMCSSSVQLRQFFSCAGKALAVILFSIFLPTLAFAQNMITNGDFENGVANFTSDYSDYTGQIDRTGCSDTGGPGAYGNPCTIIAGQYAVGTVADAYDVP